LVHRINQQTLQGQESLFKLFETLPSPVCLVDKSLIILYSNPAFTALFNNTTGSTCHQAAFHRDTPCDCCPAQQVFRYDSCEVCPQSPHGNNFDVYHLRFERVNAVPLLLQFWLDRSAPHSNIHPLFEGEKFSREILDALPEHIAILDRNGKILTVNKPWREFSRSSYQAPYRSLEGENFLELCRHAAREGDSAIEAIGRGVKAVIDGTMIDFALEFPCSCNNRNQWFMARASRFTGHRQQRTVLTYTPITELKQAEKEIEKLAYFDSLTGLPNRLLLKDRLDYAIDWALRERESLAVMFLDLDHFKVINDSLGHSAGDELLKSVAERLTGCMRKTDTVARLGGDEFVVILPNVKRISDVSSLSRKILYSLTSPFYIKEREVFTSTSIGISLFPDDGSDAETLIRNADLAMYQAKEHGRNASQFFSDEMNEKLLYRLEIETGLHHAIEQENFFLEYQEQVDLSSGTVTGVEVLLRWNHPEKGLLYPNRFLDIAEETGLIVPIGEWVIRTACQQNRRWRDLGLPPILVSINLSPRQLLHLDLVETIQNALHESRFEAESLQLEITEGSVKGHFKQIRTVLNELSSLGVNIAIDSFGSGFSSLAQLQHLPLNKLNIDHSFIRKISNESKETAIIRSIIATAHNLGLEVIAEGVETEMQYNFLKRYNCNFIQGYHFNKPVPAAEMTTFLQQKNETQDNSA